MATPAAQELPTATEHRDEAEASGAVRDSARSPSPADGTDDRVDQSPPPPLPQRPTSTHPQPLPQPFYGQNQPVYVPYTAQPNQQFAYGAPVRPLPHLSSPYLTTRIGLTVLSSIWGIIIIALTSVLLSEGGGAGGVSFYAYIIVVVSIIWNTAELITFCVRLRKQVQRGIHPGAHVGLHLLFWLAGVFATVLTVALYLGVASNVRYCERGDDDSEYDYYSSSYCEEYEPYDYYKSNVLPVFRAAIAIFVLWAINHFVLFVLACIETHKRNSLRPTAIVVPAHLNTVPTQGMRYPPPAGTQPMQPMQYYPYPIMMQPQPAHTSGAGSRTQITNEKQPAQSYQNIAGFYAPTSGPSAGPLSNNAPTTSQPQNTEQV
ncbi:hypothetical protein F5Y09DRAFT_135985 [Xylaria sp. FL1042]|nr:hypothetical protein F5Y09DRAFT_135985 [Xylaria sp. FL1042]